MQRNNYLLYDVHFFKLKKPLRGVSVPLTRWFCSFELSGLFACYILPTGLRLSDGRSVLG